MEKLRKQLESLTADDIRKMVNGELSGYPWGGTVVDVRKNQWGEWIVDCRIWGCYGYSPEDPNWHYYPMGDETCPISQFMVYPRCFTDGMPYVTMWKAKDDKRVRTCSEIFATIDEFAPPSPYIIDEIKAEMEEWRQTHPEWLK